MLDELAEQGESFAFETTLSGLGYFARIRNWKQQGYKIKIVFLRLDSEALAVNRVARRVALGGHNIPLETVLRRFKAGAYNFRAIYVHLADAWTVVDNSGTEPVVIEWSERDAEETD